MKDDAIGQVVDGYRIESVLGRGGMGVVYKAEDVALSRPVAIKRVNPSQANRDMFLHRFRAEARALARIDSPHIVSVYALRDTDLGLLIVMEYVNGGTLEDRLESGPMPLEEALPLFKQMLQAFGDAHKAGVIHRDIKPQNIMLTQDSMVKVTDFGIAKMRTQDTGKTMTQGGQGGTLKYMSPEQISDIEAVDDTSDIYALGMVAYQMLVGTLPFNDTETDFDIMRKVVEGKLPSPAEYRADLPAPLVELITTATAQKQGDRYQSTDAMMAVVEAFEQEAEVDTAGAPQPQAPTGTSEPPSIDVDDLSETPPDGETVLADSSSDAETTATATAVGSETVGGETVLASPDHEAATGPDSDTADGSVRPRWLWGAAAVALLALVGGVWALGGSGGDAASLTIRTEPEAATVYIEDDSVGVTPLRDYTRAAGPVQVRLVKSGYVPVDTTLQLAASTPHTLSDVSLTRARTRLAVETDPSDARVFVDDAAVGTTPLDSAIQVPTGEHVLRIEKDGYAPVDTTLTLEDRDEPVQMSIALAAASGDTLPPGTTPRSNTPPRDASPQAPSPATPGTATLAVQAQPAGQIEVGGEAASGQGTFEVAAGQQQVMCTHPDYGSVRTTVVVRAGEREQLQCYFERPVRVNSEPWGSVWINSERTNRTTPTEEPLYLGPGTHEVQVRIDRQDRILSGGAVRITRNGTDERERFTGYTYTLTIEPSFEPVEYAITFTD
ncbi:hypothetical protein CRI93_05720 [Longimonas halophila]|uniref:Protein kinase domain-containing protein n=1 Tax=Longimonas halophila TaxID=1469170 RepID=A0A2H3P6I2_9BACT|nr:serine/threonine-protein kinase [Longimonas halophila]PEN07942.1 hypothetical protein CRI93_05720 [Longimonas halophila]